MDGEPAAAEHRTISVGAVHGGEALANHVRVLAEFGKKKVVAVALDWPGWERNGPSEDDAMRALEGYRSRYASVAALAGLAAEFAEAGELGIVERVQGSSTTDYFGISVRSATAERERMSDAECERRLAILQACWSYFDGVPGRVSPELRKGPRGGGRDRDQIASHTRGSERELAKKVGLHEEHDQVHTPDGLIAHRDAYLDAIRRYAARGADARSWTLQYLIRRSAYHMLDHAWEMEDKDMSPAALRSGERI